MKKSQRLRLPFVTGWAGITPSRANASTLDRDTLRNSAASSGPTGISVDVSELLASWPEGTPGDVAHFVDCSAFPLCLSTVLIISGPFVFSACVEDRSADLNRLWPIVAHAERVT